MPAVASMEALQAVNEELAALQQQHPEAYGELAALLRRHRQVGYKNICKLLLGEATPAKLKGIQ